MSTKQLYEWQDAGSEIASHTVDHLDLTKVNESSLKFELQTSSKDLSNCFGTINDFAAPYGTYNDAVLTQIEKDYKVARSTDTGYNTADNLRPLALKVQNVDGSTTPEQVQQWIDTAKKNNLWLILVYHQIDENSPYSRSSSQLDDDMQTVKNSGLQIMTIDDAFAKAKK
jgi:peptidoglycan/xylan/chitin deacetylase (PgdA/CDA1 family)